MRRNPKLLAAAARSLEEQGHAVTLKPTGGPGDATRIAARCVDGDADLILAAGGDGTINEVANGMIGSQVPLGILPAGTANVLATETRLGSCPARAAGGLDGLDPVRIAVGLLRTEGAERHFLLMAGAGLDAHIVAHLNPKVKKALGKGAYWLSGWQSAFRRLEELDVECGSERVRCSFALASRVRNYGGDLEIARGASLLHEHFEVVLFEGANPLRFVKYFAGVVAGNAGRMRGVHVLPARCVTLRPASRETVHIQVDGEEAGTLPARLEVVPDALTLLLPADFAKRERQRWTTSRTPSRD
ncbi:MAG: Diacylglycerol kinase [Bryobacteraceae bacterium]|nr:Diacylglycerol kinase [Bryobacteraceae bacterium]